MKTKTKLLASAMVTGVLVCPTVASAAVSHDISGAFGPGGIEILLGNFTVTSNACDNFNGSNNCSFDNNQDILDAGVEFTFLTPNPANTGDVIEFTEADLDSLTYVNSPTVALSLILATLDGYPLETTGDTDNGEVEHAAVFEDDENENSITIWDGEDFVPPIIPSEVPLPAALPLFGTAIGLMGLVGWRKRKTAHVDETA